MRQTKFRGLNKAGVWVYGDLIQTKSNKVDGGYTCWIKERGFLGLGVASTPTAAFVEVETKTVGQLTGFQDSKGNDIYEGDIVYVAGFSRKAKAIITHEHGSEFEDLDGCHRSMINAAAENDIGEIVGNLHQNHELLEQNDE